MTPVAFDTETKGFDWFDPNEQAFLGSWADDRNEYVADLSDPAQVATYTEALASADEVIGHNLKFDIHQTRATTGYDVLDQGAVLHDTDLMSRIAFPEGNSGTGWGHGLKELATVFLREDSQGAEDEIVALAESMGFKLKGKNAGTYYDVWRAYPEQMEYYAKQDARFTYDLWVEFQKRMTPEQLRCYELEQQVIPILTRAEEIGVRIDQEPVLRLQSHYSAEAERLTEYLNKELGDGALSGEGSEDALIDALTSLGVPLYRTTEKTGKLATNAYALQEFVDEFPVIQGLFDWRTATKFLKTYIDPMVGREYVHANFSQCGAWTSRMSCRRPNMQNIPNAAGSEVREMFVPREGHVFVVCDYDSIEMRLIAWYLGDPGFRLMIDDGHDPHAWMAANIHGGSPEDFAKGGPRNAERSAAKNTLFAISYGAGAPRVSDMNKISKDEAKALISKIKSSLPNYYRLNKRIRTKIEREGHVNNLLGRTMVVNKEKPYIGLNALIQSSAAEIMKLGLVNANAAVADLGGVPLLVVHDEVVIEVPKENAEEALRVTTEALNSAYDLDPALAVTGSIVETNYADAK